MYILYRSKIEFDEIEYQISLFIRSVKRIISAILPNYKNKPNYV